MTRPLPGTWARLHPLSPLAKGARAVVAAAAVGGPQQVGHRSAFTLALDLVLLAAIVVTGVVSWLVTRWRVEGAELQIETGLLRRQSIRVPLARVQAVDLVRPLGARLLGLSELRLVLAGSGAGRSRLSYLPDARAAEVRAQLLALAHGLAGDTPEPAARPVLAVGNGRLVASVLLGPAVAFLLAALLALGAVAVVAPAGLASAFGGAFAALFAAATTVARRLNTELSFSVAEAPDGLRLTSGLLQTRAETIPYGRVQAVRLVEPLLWRPLGWCRVEIDVAQQREHEVGQDDVRQLSRALLPVGTRQDADWLLSRVLPGATTHPPPQSRPPGRARLKAPLSFHHLRSWHDPGHLAARTGRLRPATVVIPLEKVQSIRWTQGPAQRRLRLATVHVDTAGRRWQARARDRDRGEAAALMTALPELARTARQRTAARR